MQSEGLFGKIDERSITLHALNFNPRENHLSSLRDFLIEFEVNSPELFYLQLWMTKRMSADSHPGQVGVLPASVGCIINGLTILSGVDGTKSIAQLKGAGIVVARGAFGAVKLMQNVLDLAGGGYPVSQNIVSANEATLSKMVVFFSGDTIPLHKRIPSRALVVCISGDGEASILITKYPCPVAATTNNDSVLGGCITFYGPIGLKEKLRTHMSLTAIPNIEDAGEVWEVSEPSVQLIHYSAAPVISSTGEESQIAVLEDAGKELELGASEEEYPAVKNIVESYEKETPSSSLAMGEPGETRTIEAVLKVEEVRSVEGGSGEVQDIERVESEGEEHDIQLRDITNIGSPLPIDESIEQDGKFAAGGADPTRFTLRRKVEGGVITRSDGARIKATILQVENGGLPHRIATIKHDGKDYCVDAGLLESLDGSIPLSEIIEEHGHLAGGAFFDFIDRGDRENVNGEDILEATAGDGKVQEMAIEGEDDCVDFDSLKRLSPEMSLDILFERHGHLAAMEGQGQISKVTLIGRPVIWSFYGKVKYTLVEIPENGETYVTFLRKAVVKHQGQSYLVDKDTFEYMIRGESPSQIITKHGEVAREASPQAPSGPSPVEVRYIKDVAGKRLKYLVMEEYGNDKSGKYVAIVEHGGQRYGLDLDRFENAVGSVPIAQLVAKYSRGPVVPATRIVSKQTIQTQDGRSEHPLSEVFSEHGDLSSKGLLVPDEGGVYSKTVFTTVSLAGPSGEREMAVVKHADKTCYVPIQNMEQYPKQLTTIVSKHGIFVPNPEQEVRCMMCGDGWDICYNMTKIPGDFGETSCDVAVVLHDNVHCCVNVPFENCGLQMGLSATVPFNGKQYEIELGTFESLLRQQPVLFLIEEHGKLVQKISPHLDPTKLRCLVEECLDEDGVNRVKKVVISTGKDDHELELGKLETLVSHMLLEETASKHGAVRAKSQENLRYSTLNTTREVDKGENTLASLSGRDIDVIVKKKVFEEASQETGKEKRRLATMEIDDISRQFGIATLRKGEHSREVGGDVQEGEDVFSVFYRSTKIGPEITYDFVVPNTKIIFTMGPKFWYESGLARLLDFGMNVRRLTFSHGSHEGHFDAPRRFRKDIKGEKKLVACLLDTIGPEVRAAMLGNQEPINLEAGQEIEAVENGFCERHKNENETCESVTPVATITTSINGEKTTSSPLRFEVFPPETTQPLDRHHFPQTSSTSWLDEDFYDTEIIQIYNGLDGDDSLVFDRDSDSGRDLHRRLLRRQLLYSLEDHLSFKGYL
ncbi:hypothetical protein BSKO_04739 [Bryopsis sp. KO-2023]|nr:hypothetical protein BSKO_04739 [Bryopsis sp. KO-2023]